MSPAIPSRMVDRHTDTAPAPEIAELTDAGVLPTDELLVVETIASAPDIAAAATAKASTSKVAANPTATPTQRATTTTQTPAAKQKNPDEWTLRLHPESRPKTESELEVLALRQMIAETSVQGIAPKGKTSGVSAPDSARVRVLAAELTKQFAIAMAKVKESADIPPPPAMADMALQTDSAHVAVVKTSDMGLQTDTIPVVPAAVTTDVALQTDSIPAPVQVAGVDMASQTNPVPEPTSVADMAAQTESVPAAPSLEQAALEEQLAAKDADRKKWRIRAKRAESEVTTLQEDLSFIREQYNEASASAVREVLKSTDLEEKMTILQGQLKHGLKQRDLHHAAVKGQQDKEVTILAAQNKILLEQSRRTDDDVRSRAAAYPEVESQRERLEQLLRDAMRKIDDLSDRNDELVSQIEVLRAKQMGVLGNDNVKSDSEDEDYSFEQDSDAESSAAPSPSPSPSRSSSPAPTQSSESSLCADSTMDPAPAHIASVESLTASQLMPDTQDLLSAEQSLESPSSKVTKPLSDPQKEGKVRNDDAFGSPWVEGVFYANESVS
jgi:hypothetical protein